MSATLSRTELVESLSPNLLVLAPPGCGKTDLLADRAAFLVDYLPPYKRVLALTYSNRARENLEERLARTIPNRKARSRVVVKTLHGFALEVILSHRKSIGLEGTWTYPDGNWLGRVASAISSRREERDAAINLISQVKRRPYSDAEVLRELELSGNRLAVAIEEQRIAEARLEYNDLLRHAQRILRVNPVAYLFKCMYGGVIVDEIQDLSRQQLDIAVRASSPMRMFVGDPSQSIFAFAGAETEHVIKHLTDACEEVIPLSVSYRSSPAVLGVVNAISGLLSGATLRCHDASKWPLGGAAMCRMFDDRKEEADWILSQCASLMHLNPSARIGLIVRSDWRASVLYEQWSVHKQLPLFRWKSSAEIAVSVEIVANAFMRCSSLATIEEVRSKSLLAVHAADIDTRREVEEICDDLCVKCESGMALGDAIGELVPQNKRRPLPTGMHIATAHSSKGQEFDWVFVVGLEERHIPDYRVAHDASYLQDELRTLFVIVSRARLGIAVTTSRRDSGRVVQPSRWWKAVQDACDGLPSIDDYLAACAIAE